MNILSVNIIFRLAYSIPILQALKLKSSSKIIKPLSFLSYMIFNKNLHQLNSSTLKLTFLLIYKTGTLRSDGSKIRNLNNIRNLTKKHLLFMLNKNYNT